MHGQHGKPSRLSGAGSTIAETARLPIKAVYNGNKPREWGFRAVKK